MKEKVLPQIYGSPLLYAYQKSNLTLVGVVAFLMLLFDIISHIEM